MCLFKSKDIAASYTRDATEVELFSQVSFELTEGSISDLIGPSGSGKSTLLRVLALMLDATSGTLSLKGKESTQYHPTSWRCEVCLVPQTPSLIPGTVADNLLLPWKFKVRRGGTPPDTRTLEQLLKKAGLEDIELSRDASQLSGGQAARVALLRAFAAKPKVLLLDEVDAALDDESAEMIGSLTNEMAQEGAACLRIRHRQSDGFASQTFTLQEGRLTVSDADTALVESPSDHTEGTCCHTHAVPVEDRAPTRSESEEAQQ